MIRYFVVTFFKRTYRYLLLTFFSIVVGAFLFGGVVSLARSVSSYFVSQGKVLVGADVVMSSARPIDNTQPIFTDLQKVGHTVTTETTVSAVFRSAKSTSTSVASIRAVDKEEFPLYGSVQIGAGEFALVDGGIYGEQTFLNRLSVGVGDSIMLGSSTFRVLGVLVKEPDAVAVGVSFTPKVIISKNDFLRTGIDLSQSRASYKLFIRENKQAPLTETDIRALRTFAQDNKLRFDDASNGPNSLVRGLSSVQSFAGIVLSIALFLVVVNIIANLTYLLSRFRKTIALLKTYGATTLQIQTIYSVLLGLIGMVAGMVGAWLGVVASNALLPYASTFIDGVIPQSSVTLVTLFGGIVGLLIILGSALPFFRSLRDVAPKQLLSSRTSSKSIVSFSLLYYVPIPLLLIVFLYVLSQDWKLVSYSILGLVVSFAIFMGISYLILRALYAKRASLPFIVRGSVASLKYRGVEALIIMSSIMTAFSGVFIVSAVEENIVANVSQNVSRSAPALYLVDITKSQLSQVRKIVGTSFKEYAIIRGRLLSVGGRDMTQSGNQGITREFNMTYRNELIAQEEVVEGVWHGEVGATKSVSIDKEFANELGGVAIGETITVFIQGLTVSATVTSIRTTDRSSGTPFFLLVFSPDVLSTFPASYFGTATSSDSEIVSIERELGLLYPNIIPIRTGSIINTVKTLVETIVLVVKVLGIPSILLGLMLVLVMTGQSLYERKGDVLVFRAFGLQKMRIIVLFIIESCALIIFASCIAYSLAHGIAYALNTFLFSFETFIFASTPLWIVVGISIFVASFAFFVSQTLVRTPLKKLLAEK